jgi:hypothetical protein
VSAWSTSDGAAVGYAYGIVGSSRALNFGYRLRLLF